jgi:hypothetical protein
LIALISLFILPQFFLPSLFLPRPDHPPKSLNKVGASDSAMSTAEDLSSSSDEPDVIVRRRRMSWEKSWTEIVTSWKVDERASKGPEED